ncbi:tat protein, partial [Simian immunodeficiency virus]
LGRVTLSLYLSRATSTTWKRDCQTEKKKQKKTTVL